MTDERLTAQWVPNAIKQTLSEYYILYALAAWGNEQLEMDPCSANELVLPVVLCTRSNGNWHHMICFTELKMCNFLLVWEKNPYENKYCIICLTFWFRTIIWFGVSPYQCPVFVFQALDTLIELLELNLTVLGSSHQEDKVWDAMLEVRARVNRLRQQKEVHVQQTLSEILNNMYQQTVRTKGGTN